MENSSQDGTYDRIRHVVVNESLVLYAIFRLFLSMKHTAMNKWPNAFVI